MAAETSGPGTTTSPSRSLNVPDAGEPGPQRKSNYFCLRTNHTKASCDSISTFFSCTGLTGNCHGPPRDFSQDFSSLRRPQQIAPSSHPLTYVPYVTLQRHARTSKATIPQSSVSQITGNNNPQVPPPLPLRRTATTAGSAMPKISLVAQSYSQYYSPMREHPPHSQEAPTRPGIFNVHLPWKLV